MPTSGAVALVTAAALLGDTLLYSALPVNAAALGLDALAIGLILSLNRWVRLFTNPVAARLYERIPAGALVVGALALAVISTASYAVPLALALFLVARLVWGLAWSLLRLGTLLSAIDGAAGGSGAPRTGRALGNARAIYGLGYFGGALYAPFAVDALGWGAAVAGAAALTLLLGVGPALLVGGWRREVAASERDEAGIRAALLDRRFIGLFLVAASQYAVGAGILPIGGGLRVAEVFAGGGHVLAYPAAATVIAGLFILGQRVAQVGWTLMAGRLADRALPATYVASALVTAAASGALILAADATTFILLGAVAFFSGITGTVALELAIAHRTTSADRPRILGAYTTWADGGAATGALVAGFLALPGTHVPLLAAAVLSAATLAAAPTVGASALAVRASAP